MKEVVIAATARTPLAKSYRGSFNLTRPEDLLAHTIKAVLAKVPHINRDDVEDVYTGCAFPEAEQGWNIARCSALLAGLPISTGGATVNRFCASGLQAIVNAAYQIMHEGAEVAIGSGVESITMTAGQPNHKPHDDLHKTYPGLYMVMGDTAEVVAKRYGISRETQDEYALLSQQRTAAAQQRGYFDDEIEPIRVTRGVYDKKTKQMAGTEDITLSMDECNRPDTTLEGLAALKPYFDPDSGKGSVTAGNASQLSDGAAATLVMSRERANEFGITPQLIFRGHAVAGCEPDEMGIGPVYAVPKLLNRFGLTVDDIDLWELNEAFAVQVVYCREKLGIDIDKLNVNGGSISIGHPFGMSGCRLVGTLMNAMKERHARYGVTTMCIGGGQCAAALFEMCNGKS